MTYQTIDALRAALGTVHPAADPAWAEKMLHTIPDAPVVDRAGFLLDIVRGKRVLEFGASGPMHEKIRAAAADYFGVDREAGVKVVAFDLDEIGVFGEPGDPCEGPALPYYAAPEVIVCGEVLEHLSNPGWFLTRLARQYRGIPVVFTVPNAFSDFGRRSVLQGVEQVNKDHVAYYSWKTLTVLLERHGFKPGALAWYHGSPRTAEGLIIVAETT